MSAVNNHGRLQSVGFKIIIQTVLCHGIQIFGFIEWKVGINGYRRTTGRADFYPIRLTNYSPVTVTKTSQKSTKITFCIFIAICILLNNDTTRFVLQFLQWHIVHRIDTQ